jgi:hypothetical protein
MVWHIFNISSLQFLDFVKMDPKQLKYHTAFNFNVIF